MIIVPSKSMPNKPKLNISNNNIYKDISLEINKIDYIQKDTSIGNIVIYNNGEVPTLNNHTYSQYTLYSSLINDYNELIQHNQYISDNIYIINEYKGIINSTKQETKNIYLLIKLKIKKDSQYINYKYSPDIILKNNNNETSIEGYYDKYRLINTYKEKYRTIGFFEIFSSEEELLNTFLVYYNDSYFLSDEYRECIGIIEDNEYIYYYYPILKTQLEIASTKDYLGYILLSTEILLRLYQLDITNETYNANSKNSLESNELISNNTIISDIPIYQNINKTIIDEYEYGKHSVELTCLYMQYKNETGEIVYTGKDGNMIKVGDIIQPYYYDSELGDLPIATYPDGIPMNFKVYKSDILTTDGVLITNNISAIEVINN